MGRVGQINISKNSQSVDRIMKNTSCCTITFNCFHTRMRAFFLFLEVSFLLSFDFERRIHVLLFLLIDIAFTWIQTNGYFPNNSEKHVLCQFPEMLCQLFLRASPISRNALPLLAVFALHQKMLRQFSVMYCLFLLCRKTGQLIFME